MLGGSLPSTTMTIPLTRYTTASGPSSMLSIVLSPPIHLPPLPFPPPLRFITHPLPQILPTPLYLPIPPSPPFTNPGHLTSIPPQALSAHMVHWTANSSNRTASSSRPGTTDFHR